MARSLNELIAYLRGEIALCGQLGASPDDILTFINAFYSQDAPTSLSSAEAGPGQTAKQTVDRRFQEKVWTWIVKDPEVNVLQGKTVKRKTIALTDAEARSRPSNPQDDATQTDEQGIRLFVSDERTWHAIAGHGPDLKKIPQLEFDLLSIIAAQKEKGILQGDLTRLSGQDKRSVPSRTQRLADRGYIEKRPVKSKGNKTSLLIHTRYRGSNVTKEREEIDAKFMDFAGLLSRIFDILKMERIITHDDLKVRLGMTDPRRSRDLSRSIRKLERIGVIKRVRAESEQSRILHTTHKCVKLVREPDLDRDLELFHSERKTAVAGIDENSDSESEAEVEVASDQADEEIQRAEQPRADSKELQEVDVGRLLPEWSPDRTLNNIIFDVVDRAGVKGITQMKITNKIFGDFFRRPLESVLTRLVSTWLVSQPLHLRHLALIRDTEMTRSVHHFVHFSFRNFKQNVEQGKAFWEAVVTAVPGPKNKSKSASAADPNLQADVDQYGLLRAKPRYSQYNSGNASFLDCLRISDPEQYFLSVFDPVIKQLSDGKFGQSTSSLGQKTSLTVEDVAWPRHEGEELHNGPGRAPFRRPRRHRKILKPKSQALGRPRKYPAGEEAYWLSMKRRELARDVEMGKSVDLTGLETPRAIPEDGSTQPGLSRSSAELFQGPDGESTTNTPTTASVPANEDGAQLVKRARKQVKKFGDTYDHSSLPVPESVDNKWSEAVARFMDRSNPGVYVSPRGRRKPDGRKGRPPLSRIAIFKNPRLYEFPWFDFRKSRTVASHPVPRPTSLQVQTPRPARTSSCTLPLAQNMDWTVPEAFDTSIYPRFRFITSSVAHSHSLSLYAFKLAKTISFSVHAGDPVSSTFSKRKKLAEDKPVDSTQVAVLDDKPVSGQVREDKNLSVASDSTAPITKRRRLPPQKSVPARATRAQGSLGSDVTISTPLEVFVASDGPSKDVTMTDASAVISSGVPPANPGLPREIVSDDLAATDLTPTTGDQRRAEGKEADLPVDPSTEDGLTSDRLDLDHAPYEGPSKTASLSQSSNLDEHLEQTQEQRTSQEVDQIDSDEALPDIEVQENVPTETHKTPRSKAAGRMDPWGGSMALLRRKILMDIIDRCGGVFPGDNELWYPFSTQWEKMGRDTSVDRRTIKSIIKYFVDNAKLRQLKFSFKDHKGVMVTRSIVTKIEIPPTDAKVKEVQKKMIKEDPQPYFPPGAEVDPVMRMRSDVLTVQEIRNNPDRRPREVPLDLKTQVKLDSLPMKYQITERRRRQKEEQQRQRALQKSIPPKLRRLMPKGFVDASGAGPSRRITKSNVARLQKLNVRLAKPQRSNAPRDIGISQLDYLETEQGRLAPIAGAADLPAPRDMLALGMPQSFHIQDSALISHPVKWSTVTQKTHQELHTSPVFQTYTFPPRQRRLSTETSASSSTSASTRSSETRLEMPYHSPHQVIVDLRKTLPKSLDEFVFNYKRDNRDLTVNSEDPKVFNKTVDKVLRWELKHPEVFEEKSKQLQFINHEIKGSVFTPAPITWKESLPKQNRRLRDQQKKALSASGSRPHNAAAKRFAQLSFSDVLQVDAPGQPISTIEPSKTLRATPQSIGQPPTLPDLRKRRNRKRKGPPGLSESPGTQTVAPSPQARVPTVERPVRYRGSGPLLESLPETVLHRVLIATLVTRTLMGGVDSALNWILMERLFPDLGLDLLKKLWPRLQKRFHARLPELKVHLQERFIEAYEKGDVPSINFDDVESYPWDELVDWAVKTLELPTTSTEFTLPSSRAQLERSFDYLREIRPSSSEMYSGYVFATHPERQEVLSAVVFASPGDRDEEVPGVDPFSSIQKPVNELLLLAKSWVRQNAATPENTYSPQAAKEKLMKINLRTLDAATKSLSAEKVILARSGQKNAPGRTWDVSEQFLSAIDKRRIITAKMICRSAWYKKNVLELDFAEKGYSDVNVVSDDGDVFTILHLLEDGLITFSSDDVPGDELGRFHETKYQTRQMDKNLLHFSLKIQPGPGFSSSTNGGIILTPPKPRPYSKFIPDSLDFNPSLLPLWYDVHGNFFRLMWDMLICAICGLVVLRPGLTVYEIQDQLKPVMELWELRACVDWLLAVGLLRDQADRGCFRVTHGWWLRLGEYLGGDIEWEGEDGEARKTAEPISWLTALET